MERVGERVHGWLKKSIRVALSLLFLTLFLFLGYHLYCLLTEDPFFQLKEVELQGCKKIKEDTLRSLLEIEGRPNLFTLPLREMCKKISTHPWVEEVRARKIFPNKVLIEIKERKPIAILQLDGLYYIDPKGVIFSPVGKEDEYNFPFFTGLTKSMMEKDPEKSKELLLKAIELVKVIEQERLPPLERISEIHLGKIFGIECFTQAEGIKIQMGWDQFGEKVKRVSMVWRDLQRRGVSVTSIDCRDIRKVVVKRFSQGGEGKGGGEKWAKRI